MTTATQSIREIVASQASAAAVLERFEIDLCSHSGHSLRETCADLQLSVDQVLEKLAAAQAYETGTPSVDPSTMPLQKLIQHIVRLHHRTVRQELPPLVATAHKLASANGAQALEFVAINELMDDLQGEIIAHIEKEENVLFPYIAYLDQPPGLAAPAGSRCFRRVSEPVRMMMNDHDSALRILAELKRLTKGFEAPSSACAVHISFCTGLRAFEEDLKRHIQLEDDFLFPRALELESQVDAVSPSYSALNHCPSACDHS
jgi:regulator of cell morphogenesis and NO signaling